MSKFVSLLVWSKTNKLLTKKKHAILKERKEWVTETRKKKNFSLSLTIRKHKQKKNLIIILHHT